MKLKSGLVIYEPRGRAHEYAPLACNLYKGCGHGCVYCYAPESTFTDPKDFIHAAPRPDIIRKLQRDAPIAAATYTGQDKRVLVCFTCDPYQPINDIHGLTRQAIQILHANNFNVAILTKGGVRAERDFDLLGPGDEFATTLTFNSTLDSWKWEPEAAIPLDRMVTLHLAHKRGIKTWVSLEPIINLHQTLEIIRETHTYVDLYKVGKLNYIDKLPEPFYSEARRINWYSVTRQVVSLLKEYNSPYYVKQDLRGYL